MFYSRNKIPALFMEPNSMYNQAHDLNFFPEKFQFYLCTL